MKRLIGIEFQGFGSRDGRFSRFDGGDQPAGKHRRQLDSL